MHTDFDILIIGGGLVGASLACALRESGLRLGVIEAVPLAASSQPGYDDRTLALAYGSKRIFETMRVWEGIAPEATPIERIHISDRGHFGAARLTAAEAGLPALGYVVPSRALGAALLKVLEGSHQIDWLCPAEMRDIRVTPEHAAVTLHHDGKDKTLTARLVIAADGAHSAVRQAMGIEATRTEYRQTAIVTTVTASQPHGNTAYERFTDSGPLALLPQRRNDCAVVWSARAEEAQTILGWSDAEFLQRLQERFGDRLGSFTRLGRRASYPLALTRVPEQVRPRLALIGNAAHTVHPVAGQGFNLGLRDVAAMADILADAQRAGNDIGDLAVLRRYADWRRRDNQVISLFTNGLIRIFSNNIFPLTLLRNAGLLAVDLMPGVKRGFVRVTSGLAGKLPRLARGLPL
ncbi:MAG: 2-octaprenyl-6-methoxyphenyl hydroxylase [Gammaproteobacteria bacterium]|nr:2-octaprenyl-6-methoxyphenyl hydroxylase [Gammaproteobacteria bacterium]